MSYTNTYVGVDGVVLKAADANDQFDAIETAFAAVVDGQIFTGPINYRGGDNASGTNTGYGEGALDSNNGGTSNSAVGQNALTANSTGVSNCAFGAGALEANTNGGSNVAVGVSSMAASVSGSNNVAVGANTILSGTTSFNTAVGSGALQVVAANSNTAIGQAAGAAISSGAENTVIGRGAAATLQTGSQNTILGRSADTTAGASNSTAIGYQAACTADNQVVIGNSSVTETILRGQVKGGAGTGTGQPVMIGTLSVNTTQVGNVGAGLDNLMTYALPANSLSANGKGVRVTMWGTFANNANAKELYGVWGAAGDLGFDLALPTSVAGYWRIEATIIRTGSNAQLITYQIQANSTGGSSPYSMCGTGTATESDSSTITIKCAASAVADNDVVQRGMVVEFLN